MRICAVDLKGDDAIICIMAKNMGLIEVPECRQRKFTISDTQDNENMRWFQRAFKQLVLDYKIDKVVIKERAMKGKFAGGAVGFKLEAALQLLDEVNVEILTNTRIKEQLKHTPLHLDFKQTGLKQFQENAFVTAYAGIHMADAPKQEREAIDKAVQAKEEESQLKILEAARNNAAENFHASKEEDFEDAPQAAPVKKPAAKKVSGASLYGASKKK